MVPSQVAVLLPVGAARLMCLKGNTARILHTHSKSFQFVANLPCLSNSDKKMTDRPWAPHLYDPQKASDPNPMTKKYGF